MRVLSKPRKISHAYKLARAKQGKAPRLNTMKTFRKKIPYYSGVSQEVILVQTF